MNRFKVILVTTYSSYSRVPVETIFVEEFKSKKEALIFFRKYAKDNEFQNTPYRHTKLGWHNKKQAELTTNF